MNRKIIILVIFILLILIIFFIKNNDKNINNEINDTSKTINREEIKDMSVIISINNREYSVDLEDNDTVKELLKLLPINMNMTDLNNNEKYIYLDNTFTTNSFNPKRIEKGDIYLYGNNCLVIFYKSFDTNYSYTKIGHINNLEDLDNNSIEVKIYEKNN